MRWRRAIVAVVVGTSATVTAGYYLAQPAVNAIQESTAWMMPRVSDETWEWANKVVILTLLAFPAAVVALLVYGLGKPPGDGHTRCGNCGYILKGLTEPRCPECGEGI